MQGSEPRLQLAVIGAGRQEPKPASSTRSPNEADVANATSCPPSANARASGTSGRKCP